MGSSPWGSFIRPHQGTGARSDGDVLRRHPQPVEVCTTRLPQIQQHPAPQSFLVIFIHSSPPRCPLLWHSNFPFLKTLFNQQANALSTPERHNSGKNLFLRPTSLLLVAMSNTIITDSSLKPQYEDTYGFSVDFEQKVFTIAPSVIAILTALIYLYLITRQSVCVRFSPLFWIKTGASVCLLGPDLFSLAFFARSPLRRSATALAAASSACIATLLIGIVVAVSHVFALRSSALVSLYLSITVLFDAAKIHSYSSRDDTHDLTYATIATVVIKSVLLILEEIPKRTIIADDNLRKNVGNEALSGFWGRSLFVWVNKILFRGFHMVISSDDLDNLSPELSTKHLNDRFSQTWASGK